jgi:hypothetical protein
MVALYLPQEATKRREILSKNLCVLCVSAHGEIAVIVAPAVVLPPELAVHPGKPWRDCVSAAKLAWSIW